MEKQDRPDPVGRYLETMVRTEDSRRSYRSGLKHCARVLFGHDDVHAAEWWTLGYSDILRLRSTLQDMVASHSTVNHALTCLRCILRQCWRDGLMDGDRFLRCASVKGLPQENPVMGRRLTKAQLGRLLGACDDSMLGRRNRAILLVLVGCGLRRAELIALTLEDVDRSEGHAYLRIWKSPRMRLDREVPLPEAAAEAIEAWLECRGDEPGALFWPSSGAGRPFERRSISSQGVYNLCRQLARAARVKPFSPSDCRRTFIANLLDAGLDVPTVGVLAGGRDTPLAQDRRPSRPVLIPLPKKRAAK